MLYNDLDSVRVTRDLSGTDPYLDAPVAVRAGAVGAVVNVFDAACEVEFILRHDDGKIYSAVLVVDAADMEPLKNAF